MAAFELCDAALDARDLPLCSHAAPAERARSPELPVEVGQLAPGCFELGIGLGAGFWAGPAYDEPPGVRRRVYRPTRRRTTYVEEEPPPPPAP